MTRYLISFDAHAMDNIPDEDMPAVAKSSHEVVQEAVNAGVWVFGGGLETQKASVVATDGTVTDGPLSTMIHGRRWLSNTAGSLRRHSATWIQNAGSHVTSIRSFAYSRPTSWRFSRPVRISSTAAYRLAVPRCRAS